MSFQDDVAKSRQVPSEVEPVEVFVGDTMYRVEAKRLPGMEWAAVIADAPVTSPGHRAYGFDTAAAAVVACRKHGRLLDESGDPVDMSVLRDEAGRVVSDPWADLFASISHDEVRGVEAAWWTANVGEPRGRIEALKKARLAGTATS